MSVEAYAEIIKNSPKIDALSEGILKLFGESMVECVVTFLIEVDAGLVPIKMTVTRTDGHDGGHNVL